jgi:ankyrin repeat protein
MKETSKIENFQKLQKEIIEIQRLYHQGSKKEESLKSANDKSKQILDVVQSKFADEGTKILAEIIQNIKQEEGIIPKENQLTDHNIPGMGTYQNKLQTEAYAKLLAFTKLAYLYEHAGDPHEHAKKLAVVFRDKQTALNYLTKSTANSTVENACSFTLPSLTESTFEVWMGFAKKYIGDKQFQNVMANAHEIEKLVKRQNTEYRDRLKINKLLKTDIKLITAKKKEIEAANAEWKDLDKHHGNLEGYKNRSKEENKARHSMLIAEKVKLNRELLALCAGIPLKDADLPLLNAYNEAYKLNTEKALKYMLDNGLTKQNYAKFLTLERKDDDEKIPPILLDGNDLGYPGCYLKKIDVLDECDAARAACLGKKSKCCQSLSGEAGEPCVIHGLTSPNGGFYVLCQGDANNPNVEDEIIAQCWAWRSQKGAIVLDSIEGPKRDKATQKKVGAVFLGLAKELVTSGKTHKVVTGINSTSAIKNIGVQPLSDPAEKFVDYDGYYDSASQYVLYDKDCPFYLFGIDADSTNATEMQLRAISEDNNALVHSEFFTSALNWALLHQQKDLQDKIVEIAKANHSEELNSLITTMEKYINNKLTGDEILSHIENNQLPINAVNSEGLTPLMWAIQHNLTDVALKLIEKGAALNRNDNKGLTALMWSIEKGDHLVVSAILAKGTDVAVTECDRKTALTVAAENGHVDIALLLIKHGAKIHAKDRHGNTALMWAIKKRKSDVALKLIEIGADAKDSDDKNKTALMWAIQNDLTDVAIELIKKSAEVNAHDSTGETSLILATERGHENVVNALMLSGADPNAKNDKDKTALMCATNDTIANELITNGAQINAKDKQGKTALMWAIENQHSDVALKLISLGADVKPLNDKKQTAMMLAAKYGLKEILIALIKNDVNVNAKDHKNKTALMWAVKNGYKDIALELISKGADVNAIDDKGKTVLMHAAIGGNAEIMSELVSKGVSIAAKDNKGKTALMWASNGDIAQKLIEQGAKIDDIDNNGITPLLHAIENERSDIAIKLIEHGAQVNVSDQNKITPLMLAAQKCDLAVIPKLLEKGAEINAEEAEDGKTALQLAAEVIADRPGVEDTVLMLIENGANYQSIADDSNFEELLLWAIEHDRQTAALKLIEVGANVDVADRQGKTALIWAIEKGYQDIALALIEKTRDVNVADEDGKTPLMWTAIGGKRDVIIAQELVKHGGDINAKDKEGKTALMWDEELNSNTVQKTDEKESSRKKFTPQFSNADHGNRSRDEFDKCLRGTLKIQPFNVVHPKHSAR